MRQKLRYVIGLLFLAPLIAEFLYGNQPITALPWIFFITPVYGGAAVIIREITRRGGRGWPSILLLGAAFGLLLEGIIDQMIFNPAYLGLQNFDGLAPIPAIQSSAYLIQTSITIHAIWSITIPIALIEAFDPTPEQPWLGKKGLIAIVVLFILGSTFSAIDQYEKFHFMATPLQLGITTVGIIFISLVALLMPLYQPALSSRHTYKSRNVGLVTFLILTFGYYIASLFLANTVIWWFLFVGLSITIMSHWIQSSSWSNHHGLAVVGGAVYAYICIGFIQAMLRGIPIYISVPGNIIFGVLSIILLHAAIRRQAYHNND